MTSKDLVKNVAAKQGLTEAQVRAVLDDLLSGIVAAAAKGEDVLLLGFGKFTVKASAAREGRNPRTGAPMAIAASKKLAFAAAKAVKEKL